MRNETKRTAETAAYLKQATDRDIGGDLRHQSGYSGSIVVEAEGGISIIGIFTRPKSASGLKMLGNWWNSQGYFIPYGEPKPSFPRALAVTIPDEGIPVVDSSVSDLIRSADGISVSGYDVNVVNLADPEYVERLREIQAWYRDENVPAILNQLEGVSDSDYNVGEKYVIDFSQPETPELRNWRALMYLEDRNALYGERMAALRDLVMRSAVGPQGHTSETFFINVGEGKYPEYKPSRILQEKIGNVVFQRDLGVGTSAAFIALTAPPYIHIFGIRTVSISDEWICRSEITRLILLDQLTRSAGD